MGCGRTIYTGGFVCNIVNIPSSNPQGATINMLAPVVINIVNKKAMQIILKNTEFEELLQDIKDKKCNTIVVLKLDRLTRSVYDMEDIMKFLDENNAYLDCANEEINTTNSSGKMVARLLTTVSQNEIERTSERTKFGMAGAIKAGHIPGVTPLGYDRVDKKLVINPIDKEVIERIFNISYPNVQQMTELKRFREKEGMTHKQISSILHYIYDVKQELSSNQFIREGYTFKEWNTISDGSGTSYMPGQMIVLVVYRHMICITATAKC